MGNFVTCLLHAQLPTSLPVFLVGIFALTGDTMGPLIANQISSKQNHKENAQESGQMESYFTNLPDFPEIREFPLLFTTIWVVFSRLRSL